MTEEFKTINPNEGFVDIEQLRKNKDIMGLIDVVQHAQKRSLVKEALFSLGEVDDKTAIPALFDYALYGQHGMAWRNAAIQALGHIGKHEVVEQLIYIMLINKGRGWTACGVAAKTLGEIKDERALKPLTFVMNDSNEENKDDREEAIKALGLMATKESITAIIGVLDRDLAEIASSVLKEVGQPALEPLVSALSNANQNIREKAAIILEGMVLDTEATESLLSILKSDSVDTCVIKSVVMVLGRSGDKSATKPLLEAFKKFLLTNADLAEEIIKALGKIKDSSAAEPLLKVLTPEWLATDDNEVNAFRIQYYLIFLLGRLGNPKATTPLLKLLLNKANYNRIRVAAAWALGGICDKEAIEQLVSVLSDGREDYNVRLSAFTALFNYPDDTAAAFILGYLKAHPDLIPNSVQLPFSGDNWPFI